MTSPEFALSGAFMTLLGLLTVLISSHILLAWPKTAGVWILAHRPCQYSLAQRRAVCWAVLSAALTALRAMARVLLAIQHGYPSSFRDRLHFFPVRLKPVSILAFYPCERKHGRVVNGVREVRPFGVCVLGFRLLNKRLWKVSAKI